MSNEIRIAKIETEYHTAKETYTVRVNGQAVHVTHVQIAASRTVETLVKAFTALGIGSEIVSERKVGF